MNGGLIFVLTISAIYFVPLVYGKLVKSKAVELKPNTPSKILLPEKRRIRRKRSSPKSVQQEDEFPDYDPTYNDEADWRSVVEPKFRKHPDYPPDWQRRRALVFIRDGGRCQSEQHRGGTCGWLRCEPSQIWNFAYNVRLLEDAHVDHIKLISFGGSHDLSNLQLLCARCHSLKHPGNTKLEAMVLPRIAPRGKERKKYLANFYKRKAPKPPDEDVPF